MSDKETLILSVCLLSCTGWAVWTLFNPPAPALFNSKITNTLLLLSFLLYVYLCLKQFEFEISFINPLLFFLMSLAFVVIFITQFALIYNHFGLLSLDNCVIYDVLDCLYFSIITFTTVGYGDFRPTSDVRLYAGFEALTGVVFFSLFIPTFIHITNHIRRPLNSHSDDAVREGQNGAP
jgi:hypothetical protein